ncbi:hypothetical protein HDU92_002125 [Lobulomyces angularis]|nr:hypothetical protein HDU92_002125 [Lobulomyces angularis]
MSSSNDNISSEFTPLLETSPSSVRINENLHLSSSLKSSFNLVNVLLGSSILSLPFAFKLSGWVMGLSIEIIFFLVTLYTALLMSSLMNEKDDETDSKKKDLKTFADIGRAAFGDSGMLFTSILFTVDLFIVSASFIILSADSFCALFPSLNLTYVKVVIVLCLTPFTWFNSLSILAYGSFLGIISLINLIIIVFYDGLSTSVSPGSILNPADTILFPSSWFEFPMAFGLLIAGFGCHTVIPQIFVEMKKPKQYKVMVTASFSFVVAIYISFAAIGYLMFGETLMHEISLNLSNNKNYNLYLTNFTIWLIAVNPLTKFPLTMSPVNQNLERILEKKFVDFKNKPIYTIIFRSFNCLLVLLVTILFPGFNNVIALLGSMFTMTVSVVFPCLCNLRLKGCWFGKNETATLSKPEEYLNWFLVCSGGIVGLIGTIWAFIPVS